MDAFARRDLRSNLRIEILEFAKRRGCVGFTVEEITASVGGNPDVVRSRLNSLRISGRIAVMVGKELNKAGTAKVGRYRFKESVADAILEKAARDYTTLNPVTKTRRYANVDDCIKTVGHDEDFIPEPEAAPTAEVPGSQIKLQILASRVARGEELWHEKDPVHYHARCEQIV